jgi:hypothetical protein
MDCTSSMGPYIEAAKREIAATIEELERDYPTSRFEVAFIGYRDYGDEEQSIQIGWGTVESLLDRLQGIEAKGGFDAAEDVAHGLLHVAELAWTADVRILVHIGDAPPHGIRYHRPSVSDRFPDGDPDGVDCLTIVSSLSTRNINYTFMRINHSTDTMVELFHNSYIGPGRFRVVGLRQFHQLVSDAVSDSIDRHTSSQDLEEV